MGEKVKDIYNMELHEIIYIKQGVDSLYSIARVPGGWLYNIINQNGNFASSFIPYSNEFMKISTGCED